jgi:hypothetical protein
MSTAIRALNEWIKQQGYKPIHHFTIARVGWEMDNLGCVVESKDGTFRFVTTNHGSPCFAEPSEVQAYANKLGRWSEATMTALALLGLE